MKRIEETDLGNPATASTLMQSHYELFPRDTDGHQDRHRYLFRSEADAEGGMEVDLSGVDLYVAAGVNYPERLGVGYNAFTLDPSRHRVSLSGNFMPGTVDHEQLGVLALGLANTIVQFEAATAQSPTASPQA